MAALVADAIDDFVITAEKDTDGDLGADNVAVGDNKYNCIVH